MGAIKDPPYVLFLIAAFSRDLAVLEEGRARAVEEFGPIALQSPLFRVDDFTDYYVEEMGRDIHKQLWCFENPIDPARLAAIKVQTNGWEEEFANDSRWQTVSVRPINLDPGYIDLGKLILASTKDHSHRIYLQQGIFAETTLIYRGKQWQALPWSYPDYQSPEYQKFLTECRNRLHTLRRNAPSP